MKTKLVLPRGRGKAREQMDKDFAAEIELLSSQIGFSLSSRGWAYQLEGFGLITKDEFDLVQGSINKLRKNGLLPIDFTAEEQGRQFKGIEWPTKDNIPEFTKSYLEATLECEEYYTSNWWQDEEYYIQMIVEKIDLVSLFEPVCRKYHIPIATTSGWASMLMRANYASRFRYYENKGYKCVLLYCGDHDPAGLQISDFLRSNLEDLKNIRWTRGASGYDPENLIIERFGLDAPFIDANNLSWIDNLITGSGRNLSDPNHPDNAKKYVQEYLTNYGARKCEANALVVAPQAAEKLVTDAIEKYLGTDSIQRFEDKEQDMKDKFEDFRDDSGITTHIEEAIEICDKEIEENGKAD